MRSSMVNRKILRFLVPEWAESGNLAGEGFLRRKFSVFHNGILADAVSKRQKHKLN